MKFLVIVVTIASFFTYLINAVPKQDDDENLAANEIKTDVRNAEVLGLDRVKRAPIVLNFCYHPENPYTCYTITSDLYCKSQNFSLQVQSSNTIIMVKQAVQAAQKYPVELQVLKYGIVVLQDQETVSSYNIVENNLIDLTLSQVPK